MGTFALTLVLTTGCGNNPGNSQSQTKVTNGKKISESVYPAVAFLVGYPEAGAGYMAQAVCTGTFVNDHQLLTASHCVEGLDAENPALYYVTKLGETTEELEYTPVAQAITFVQHPNYSSRLGDGVNQYDVAIVEFPAGTAPASIPVSKTQPKPGDALTIVGYGNNAHYSTFSGDFDGTGSGIKRLGTNEVAFLDTDMIGFFGVTEEAPGLELGEYVASGAGDSGGPMLIDGKLIGVTSGGSLVETEEGYIVSLSLYVDLTSDSSKQFLDMYLDGE